MMGLTAVRILRAGALLLASCATVSAVAQTGTVMSRPVVQPTGTAQLNEALARLSANPQDVGALLDASNAALQLGDVEAAIGFLTRADSISPRNARVKALMGSALLRNDNPYDAIGYFDQADAAGASASQIASDRGLAFDLVGAQVPAQAFYKIAMAGAPSEEVTRRYALSLAVSGDRRAADAILNPLIQRQDPAAWRTRTFILAISGQEEEAISVANAMMPKHLADAIAPYLRYMPRLTRAQQIAAATFGKFPRAADIGRDDPRAARFAQVAPPPIPVTQTPPALAVVTDSVPKDRAAKDRAGKKDRKNQRDAVRIVAVQPPAATEVAAAAPSLASAARPASPQAPVTSPLALPSQPARPLAGPPTPSAASPVSAGVPSVAVPVVQPLPQVAAPATAPASVPIVQQATAPVVEPPAEAVDFSAAFGNFRPPAEEQATAVAAVDITRITPARPAPKQAEPVLPASQPKAAGSASSNQTRANEPASVRSARGVRPDAPADVSRTPAATPPTTPAARSADRATARTGASVAAANSRPERAGSERAGSRTTTADAKAATAKAATAKDSKVSVRGKKAKEPANPSRIWVQLSTGSNRQALPQDWRRLQREAPDVLRGKKPYVTAWRSNFRLLTGPFESDAAARAFVNQLRRADVSSFSWSSDAGQAVDPLPTGR